MRREHTVAWYRERVDMLREAISGCALSTDIIVGFPGETEADFQATFDLMAEVRYNSAYIFIYSPRPHTPAASIVDALVPHAIAVDRLERLNDLQRGIGTAYLLDKVGTIQSVLVQGAARRARGGCRVGRSKRETVVIDGDPELVGSIVPVRITGLSGITLHGSLEQPARRGATSLELPVLAG